MTDDQMVELLTRGVRDAFRQAAPGSVGMTDPEVRAVIRQTLAFLRADPSLARAAFIATGSHNRSVVDTPDCHPELTA